MTSVLATNRQQPRARHTFRTPTRCHPEPQAKDLRLFRTLSLSRHNFRIAHDTGGVRIAATSRNLRTLNSEDAYEAKRAVNRMGYLYTSLRFSQWALEAVVGDWL